MVAGVLIGAILTAPFQVVTDRPAAVTVKQLGEALMGPHVAALLIVGLIVNDVIPGAQVDDVAIPPLLARIYAKLAPLLEAVPVVP